MNQEQQKPVPEDHTSVSNDEESGARGLQRDLQDRLQPEHDELVSDSAPHPEAPAGSGRMVRRLLKVGIGLAIVAVFGWLPLRAVLQTSSVEAVVNARIVTLRSPIDGTVSAKPQKSTQLSVVREGDAILHVVNGRGDRARLDDLRRQMSRLENERPSLAAKLAAAETAQQDLARQASQFRDGRILQLEARIAEIQTAIEAAAARREEAVAAVERASSLIKSGSVSTVEMARLTREQAISQQTEIGARRRLDAAKVELTAARNGTYLGDSYNDRPSSVQREEEMRQRVSDLRADLAHADAEIGWLTHEIAAEQLHYVNRAEADIKAPVGGRIWEMMTSPGEDVRAGQPLLKLLDCSGAVVTANVTESVYNGLKLGEQASFEPNDGSAALQGEIVNLTGASGAPANLAINPDALNKEPYRVTVSMPALDTTGKDCAVGRTGRVVFNADAAKS
ncbi:HlyD family efflux transporter periplasmic adaptor subunit [Bradyrhizobium elkanii]|uniref:HlyD family efflux transporter periplasmic adaptor subunit n=1 Tax=Bradyrhizobium elkanii TaxID=29448 RepID=UPI001FD8AF23|nr:HlyD family secretion protein [Bradyrhizobium elkanii]MCS3453933.1 multidrug resistance efflux pump [Bradyrhizobium elkanii]MCS3567020.1 multidrug resistance efflux pump [Bradyrhizobium elkanii]MCW2153921.1 multidrug resistance efflux pump [Bradyrhizobium elkanii]MCW2380247.1 multidrug resistance efflux pump [Bradyrhizobium elkanii]WLC12637.1 HlyD family efflux transporter periplasmic adaptor subunit [Bradyrhizobium elkanii USDA 94]